MIKLVIFDLDGTLVDTATDIMEAANKVMETYRLAPLPYETVRAYIGEGFSPFIRYVAHPKVDDAEFAREIFERFQKFYDQQLLKHTGFFDGVENFLTDYQKIPSSKIGVVSNKPEYQVRIILKGLGVREEHLVQIYGGDTFEYKKPDPRPLQHMMELSQVQPEETVMIGDSRADVEAAKAAGTHFIGVTFGYNTLEALTNFGASRFINHFDELLPLLNSLGVTAG